MISLFAVLVMAATPAPPPTTSSTPSSREGPPSLLVLDLKAVGVHTNELAVLDGLLGAELTRTLTGSDPEAFIVFTSADLRTLSNVEAQRSLSGCDDESASCLAEIAGAMGARYVVTGNVGALGDKVVLQMSLVDTTTARALSRVTRNALGLSALADEIPSAVTELAMPLGGTPRPMKENAGSGLLVAGGVVTGLGVVVGALGFGGLLVLDQRLAPGAKASTSEKEEAIRLAAPALGVGIAGAAVAAIGVIMASIAAGSSE